MLSTAVFLVFCVFVVFAVKLAVFPFSDWFVEVHSQASTVSSTLLSAVVLKLAFFLSLMGFF